MFDSRRSFRAWPEDLIYERCIWIEEAQEAQTWIFFMLAWGTIMLLCGLAIDSGLLYLAKARLSRAVDGAALAAVGNFNRDPSPHDESRRRGHDHAQLCRGQFWRSRFD